MSLNLSGSPSPGKITSPGKMDASQLSIGQLSTLFDKYIGQTHEQQRLQDFRRYMVDTKVTNLCTKLLQYCHRAYRQNQVQDGIVQEFLATYPGESEKEMKSLLEARVRTQKENVQLMRQIKKKEAIVRVLGALFPKAHIGAVHRHLGKISFGEFAGKIGVHSPQRFRTPPENEFPFPSRKELMTLLDSFDPEEFDSIEKLYERICDSARGK